MCEATEWCGVKGTWWRTFNNVSEVVTLPEANDQELSTHNENLETACMSNHRNG